jgi:hypothetical protein
MRAVGEDAHCGAQAAQAVGAHLLDHDGGGAASFAEGVGVVLPQEIIPVRDRVPERGGIDETELGVLDDRPVAE